MWRTKLEPMKPAPPVTTILMRSPPSWGGGAAGTAASSMSLSSPSYGRHAVRASSGSCGMGRSLVERRKAAVAPAGRPAAVVIGSTSTARPAQRHDLAGQLAPAAVPAAGHVVDARAEAGAQRLDDGRREVAGVGRRADLVVDDPQRLADCARRARAPPPGWSSRSCVPVAENSHAVRTTVPCSQASISRSPASLVRP